MILEISLVLACIVVLTELYIIVNLYNKTDRLEQWADSTYINIQNTIQAMRDIDSTGHFEADDEVGTIFQELKKTIDEMDKITTN